MRQRLRAADGFGLVEMVAAMTVLAIALLSLLAGYGSAVLSLRASATKTSATELANAQLELYRALPYASIGLDAATVAAIGDDTNQSYDSLYDTNAALAGQWVTDPSTGQQTQLPSGTVNDVVISGCGSSANCLPVQVVTGSDHHSYRIETYVRDEQNPYATTGITWTERIVTVVVRDAQATGEPELAQLESAFDRN